MSESFFPILVVWQKTGLHQVIEHPAMLTGKGPFKVLRTRIRGR